MNVFKLLISKLPATLQNDLKRIHYWRQMKTGAFVTSEPEYDILHSLIVPGDWVIDVGANVGHYTKRLSDLVGQEGRVIAFEPVPQTFSMLSSNVQYFRHSNTTLLNVALSNKCAVVNMEIPSFDTGLKNFYGARLTAGDSSFPVVQVMTIPLDSLEIPIRIALVKIDVEGHELLALGGMVQLLRRDRPTLIVESGSDEVSKLLVGLGYNAERFEGSPNLLFRPASR
jgi:FkbM family methyltransferase